MIKLKELKSIEVSSYTIMATAITVVFSIIAAIIAAIAMGVINPNGISIAIYIIPTIIVGTFMYSIYNYFTEGLFYNSLAKKLRTISVAINDENEIVKISTTETAIMISIISTLQMIILYLVSIIALPFLLSSMIQTLIYTGQTATAYGIYQFLSLINQPTTVLMFIFGIFIICFVFVLLGTYIYNFMAKKGKGVVLNLSEENGLTVIDSIDPLKLAIMFAIITGVLSLITGIISVISGADIASLIGGVIGGLISGFIEFYIIGFFYNFLAPKIGKIKIELIDFKIN